MPSAIHAKQSQSQKLIKKNKAIMLVNILLKRCAFTVKAATVK